MSLLTITSAAQEWAAKREQVSNAVDTLKKQGVKPDEIDKQVFSLYCEQIDAENNLAGELMKHAIDAGGLRDKGIALDAGRPGNVLSYPETDAALILDALTPENRALRDAITNWRNARHSYFQTFRTLKKQGKSNTEIDIEIFGLYTTFLSASSNLADVI